MIEGLGFVIEESVKWGDEELIEFIVVVIVVFDFVNRGWNLYLVLYCKVK